MLRSILIQALLVLSLTRFTPAHATDYYLTAHGSDDDAGTQVTAPWKSLQRANQQTFKPGDRLLLQGGETFNGALQFDAADSGNVKKPFTISSFGDGKAIIDARDGNAIDLNNAGGVVIENLEVRGSSYPKNQGNGIYFHNQGATLASTQPIVIRKVDASGFAGRDQNGNGIFVLGQWRRVRIEDCQAHGNRFNGIFVNGARGVKILRCRAWDNPGDPEFHENWSGCGIFVVGAFDALIDHCEAWHNGYLSNADSGGPVGIWAASTDKVVIQYCHSHHNGTNGIHDGGGFDFDGGVTHGLMQYNYSHDNDGPGYLIYEWGAGGVSDIVVHDNVSVNDGGKNGYAGFFIGSDAPNQGVSRCRVEHNTVIARPQGLTQPVALRMYGLLHKVVLSNNLFVAQGVPVMDATVKPDMVRLVGNKYLMSEGAVFRWNGKNYETQEEWQKAMGK